MPEWMERETEGSVPAGVQGCNPLVALIKPLIMEIWFCFTFHTVAHWSVIQIWDLVIFTFFSSLSATLHSQADLNCVLLTFLTVTRKNIYTKQSDLIMSIPASR